MLRAARVKKPQTVNAEISSHKADGSGTAIKAPSTAQAKPKNKKEVLEMPVIRVVGTPDKLQTLPGSVHVLEQETLFKSHVFTTNEALRKVPGVNVRDEEGFGMRPKAVRRNNQRALRRIQIPCGGIRYRYSALV